MQKGRKIFISFCLTVIALFSVITATFAYFNISNIGDISGDINVNITVDNNVEVNDFASLYVACKNDTYNDSNVISSTSNRKTIKFMDDITLINDLFVSADVHINLNNHTLNLNGYTLTITHGYKGSILIYNGTIDPSVNQGKIVIDTENATCIFDNISTLNTINENDYSEFVNINQIDFSYMAYNAFYEIAGKFTSDIEKRPDLLTYDEFSLLDEGSFTTSLFVSEKVCELSSSNEICSFVCQDVDLLTHYLSKDIKITYSSSNENVFSSLGNVTTPSASEDITLNVSVAKDSDVKQLDFKIYVVNVTNEAIKNKVGKSLILSYLQDYYKEGPIHGFDDYCYVFTNGITLPLNANSYGVTYTYQPLDVSSNNVDTVSIIDGETYKFEPNENCYYLKITINNSLILTLNMFSNYVANNKTIALKIINELYGGSIVYDSSNDYVVLKSLQDIANDENPINTYHVSSITYSLNEGSLAYQDYEISDNRLTLINPSRVPDERKETGLTCTFSFTDGEKDEVIDLYIVYVEGSGDTASNYFAYYTIYDSSVEGIAQKSFYMPFSYKDNSPYTIYEFSSDYVINGDGTYTINSYGHEAISSVLVYDNNGVETTLSSYSFASTHAITSNFIKDQFDAKIGNSKISDTFASYDNKDLKWKITIDYSKLDVEDKDILMIYYYTFNDGASSWKRYEKVDENGVASLTELTSSSFILNGGLVYGNNTNNVSDANLFVYLYNLFNVNNETIRTSSTLTDYVISNDWFNFNKVIDVSMLTSISNFNGIQHFVNVQKANFSNVSLDSTSIAYISQMKGLEDLNMSNCNLSDSSTLSNLSSLSKLHTLDVSNNTIDNFSFLLNISSLTSVSLYNNNETKTYLGSKGMSNYYVYDDLKRQGIVVYYQLNSNNVPVSFDESTELNDYQRLKSIEYQSIINVGEDITSLYAPFKALSTTNFNIASGSLTWSYGGGSNANDATYFSVTWSDGTNTMIVKFYVDRQ